MATNSWKSRLSAAYVWLRIIALFLGTTSSAVAELILEQVGRFASPNKDFLHVQIYGNYLYAGTFSSGWYVIDVREPSSPVAVRTNNTPLQRDVWGMRVAEDVLVTSHGSRAYMYNLSDPANPLLAASSSGGDLIYTRDAELFRSFLIPGDWGLTQYRSGAAFFTPLFNAQIIDMDASGEHLYAIGNGLFVIKWSGLELMAASHVSTFGTGIRASGDTLLVTGPQGLVVYDISNPVNPSSIESGFAGTGMINLEIAGQYAYVASGTNNGVQVVDWSDRRNIEMAGWFKTAGSCNEICVSGDYIYVADGLNGIVVLKQTNATTPAGLTIFGSPPTSAVLRTGETMTLAVEATSSSPISYRWSASELLPETGPSFTLTNVNRSHSGVFTLQVTDGRSTETFQTTVRVIGNLQTTFIPSSIPPMVYVMDPNGVLDARYLILERSTNLTDWSPILDSPFVSDPPGAFNGFGNDPATPSVFYRVMEGQEPFF